MYVCGALVNDPDGKTKILGENPVALPICPPLILNGLAWNQTWASVVTG